MATPIKKACDPCHKRKIKCSGDQPCTNCGQTNLQCTYLAIPQKKGPKGSRGKVITGIRNTQKDVRPPTTRSTGSNHALTDIKSPPTSPLTTRNPTLLSRQTVESCINFFFSDMSTTAWILDKAALVERIDSDLTNDNELYCLVGSLCAFVMVQPGVNLAVTPGCHWDEPPENRYAHANFLLEDVNRARKNLDYVETPSLSTIQTSFFLFSCYFTLEKQNTCWYHLREAATLAQIMNMHEESSYHTGDAVEYAYRRRIYWLLLVTERAYAMERHRPLTLHPTIELPLVQDEDDSQMLSGFSYLIRLFTCIDDQFMALWNKVKDECSAGWLSNLQQRLINAIPTNLETTESQVADVKITQHWLRTMVWQLSIMHGCITSAASDVSMTFTYPIQVARDLVQDVSLLSADALELHGIGLIEKLFDIACTLTDVVACVPFTTSDPESDTPYGILNKLLNMISHLRGGASRYLPLLLTKMSETLPTMAQPAPRTFDPRRLSIVQGYAGATDNLPIPEPTEYASIGAFGPEGFVFDTQYTMNQPVVDGHDTKPLMFDTFSPDSDHLNRITPSSLGTPPQGYFGQIAQSTSPHILAPVPRSIPAAILTESNSG
jgi:hypothetical protein